jgi:hypothetical protein
MSHAKREVGAACALLLVQRRSRDNRPGRPHRPLAKSFEVARVSAEEHMCQLPCGEGALGQGKLRRGSRAER